MRKPHTYETQEQIMTPSELWEAVKDSKHDNHSTDLYIPVTPENTELIRQYEFRTNVSVFVSQIDEKYWYDIPFAYQPEWGKRTAKPALPN